MYKRIITYFIVLTLLAGFSFSPAQAYESSKLQNILQISDLPEKSTVVIDGKSVTLEAHLDRGQFVYGLPNDIPDNDWKSTSTSWWGANKEYLGILEPEKTKDLPRDNQEPRYLGFTWNRTDPFSNSWFPDDEPNKVSPAKRDMIDLPWKKGYCNDQGRDDFSDNTWGVIWNTLQPYHKHIGFDSDENSFINNPAFQGNDDKVRDYFKVLAEPRPGLAGAVKHWHYRNGVAYYQTITVNWDIIPDFIVDDLDPGTEKAEPGKTYTGKVVLKAKPDTSFLSDPITSQLFNTMDYKLILPEDYAVPFGITVNGSFIPVSGLEPIPGLTNIYYYKVKAGKADDTLEVPFTWTAGAGPVTIGAGVNESLKVLNRSVWGYMDWSEITSVNNALIKPVPTSLVNLWLNNLRFEQNPIDQGEVARAYVTAGNDSDHTITTSVDWWIDPDNDPNAKQDRKTVTIPAKSSVDLGLSGGFSFTPAKDTKVAFEINSDYMIQETTHADNLINGVISVSVPQQPAAQGSGNLTFQAVKRDKDTWEILYSLDPGTAKWATHVITTLHAPEPVPPKGTVTEWHITSATLYYPQVADDWTFVHWVEPVGTVTVDMTPAGHTATVEFLEDWSNVGAPIYDMLADDYTNEARLNPRDYKITAEYAIHYVYEWYEWVPDGKGGSVKVKRTAEVDTSGSATGYLTVNGTSSAPFAM